MKSIWSKCDIYAPGNRSNERVSISRSIHHFTYRKYWNENDDCKYVWCALFIRINFRMVVSRFFLPSLSPLPPPSSPSSSLLIPPLTRFFFSPLFSSAWCGFHRVYFVPKLSTASSELNTNQHCFEKKWITLACILHECPLPWPWLFIFCSFAFCHKHYFELTQSVISFDKHNLSENKNCLYSIAMAMHNKMSTAWQPTSVKVYFVVLITVAIIIEYAYFVY